MTVVRDTIVETCHASSFWATRLSPHQHYHHCPLILSIMIPMNIDRRYVLHTNRKTFFNAVFSSSYFVFVLQAAEKWQ